MPETSSLDFDQLREALPAFGLAVYALTPGGEIVAEAVIQDEVISATGDTLSEALERLANLILPGLSSDQYDLEFAGAPAAPDPKPQPTAPDIFG